MKQTSSYTESCIGEICFTASDANDLRNFDGAKSWCTSNNSALAVVSDSDTQMALTQFLKSSNMTEMIFINIKLYQHDKTWFLVNGSTYMGSFHDMFFFWIIEYKNLYFFEEAQQKSILHWILSIRHSWYRAYFWINYKMSSFEYLAYWIDMGSCFISWCFCIRRWCCKICWF